MIKTAIVFVVWSFLCTGTIVESTRSPFFIEINSRWTKIQNYSIVYANSNSREEFLGLYKSKNQDYILLVMNVLFSRTPSGDLRFVDTAIRLSPSRTHKRYYIIGKGNGCLWIVESPYITKKKDILSIQATGKKQDHLKQNAFFVADEPKSFISFQTKFDGKNLDFKTEYCDTIAISLITGSRKTPGNTSDSAVTLPVNK